MFTKRISPSDYLVGNNTIEGRPRRKTTTNTPFISVKSMDNNKWFVCNQVTIRVYETCLNQSSIERTGGLRDDTVSIRSTVRIVFEISIKQQRLFCKAKVVHKGRFSFEKDKDGGVNLIYIETYNSKDRTIIYKDCTYFGLDIDSESAKLHSKFVVSNATQDKMIPTAINLFNPVFDSFHDVVYRINEFIQQNINKTDTFAMPLLKTANEEPEVTAESSYFLKINAGPLWKVDRLPILPDETDTVHRKGKEWSL